MHSYNSLLSHLFLLYLSSSLISLFLSYDWLIELWEMSGCWKDLGIGRKGETHHKGVGPLGDDSQPSGNPLWFELGAGKHDRECRW